MFYLQNVPLQVRALTQGVEIVKGAQKYVRYIGRQVEEGEQLSTT